VRPLLLLLALLPAHAYVDLSASPPAAEARATERDCAELPRVGCWYAPPSAQRSRTAPLLVYHRGFHPQLGRVVPPGKALESARQAFSRFELAAAARKAGAVLLVTASSPVSLTADGLAALEAASGLTLGPLYFAAHSGGYEGLAGTLEAFPSPARLVMLDNFYFGAPLAENIGAAAKNAEVCAGFYTTWKRKGGESNEDRLKKVQRHFPGSCLFENQDGKGHDGGVTACLGPYLAGAPCR
jgi:hypothetical protein